MLTHPITFPADAIMDAGLLAASGPALQALIQARVAGRPAAPDRDLLARALRYLYDAEGAVNSPLARVCAAERGRIEALLLPAERLMHRYLFTRTNGSERRHYGQHALQQLRAGAKYRCEVCDHPDVRVLQLDHIDGNRKNTAAGNFMTLCANHHQIKSRLENWTGKAAVLVPALVAL